MRTIVIGDVHGCYVELLQLLEKLNVDLISDDRQDRVIIAGDLVDRGPASPMVVRFCRENNIEAVCGNHDDKHVRMRRNNEKARVDPSYKNKMQPFDPVRLAEHNALSDQDHDWLASLPDTIAFTHNNKPFVVVHGGLMPHIPWKKQPRSATCRLTWIDQTTGNQSTMRGSFSCPPNGVYWASKWPGPESIIYGHYVDNLKDIRFHIHNGYTTYGIDTGCVFNGHLTAVVLEEGRDICYAQVPAIKKYAHRDLVGDE